MTTLQRSAWGLHLELKSVITFSFWWYIVNYCN